MKKRTVRRAQRGEVELPESSLWNPGDKVLFEPFLFKDEDWL